MLSAPLRDRFQIREHLDFYTPEELAEIVQRNAAKLSANIDPSSTQEIALRSRGTPRVANNVLRWVRDYATSRADGHIRLEITRAALEMAGIDALGLSRQDRKYLETLIRVFGGGPAGVEALAHTMNTSTDTLADEVEPFLLRRELVVRTTRGASRRRKPIAIWTSHCRAARAARPNAACSDAARSNGPHPTSPVPSSVTVMVPWNADEADDADERGGSAPAVHDGPP